MELDQLKKKAASLFPAAVTFALENPGQPNADHDELQRLCWSYFKELGFYCQADCFDAVVPRVEGELTLAAWSTAKLDIHGWELEIRLRCFYLGGAYAHFEVRHDGPLPGLTQTGYRSIFVPLSQIAGKTPREYLSEAIPPRPKVQQLTLF